MLAANNQNVVDSTSSAPSEAGRIGLYAAHKKAYPRFLGKGRFRQIKWLVTAFLFAIYWGAPWLRWDRGAGAPDQAILIDLPGRRAYFFSIEIWPQEVYYLTGLLIIAALGLFFVSALLGRVWCGFTCFQTVFTDVFVWFEKVFQGERNARMRLDAGPWTLDKLWRKAATQASWIVVSVLTGYGFVLYFDDAGRLTGDLLRGQAGASAYGFLAVVGGFCYLLAGYAREQVCIYMCPYSRFQSAMFDEHSMIVSYEAWRGEPRGHLKGSVQGRSADEVFAGRGHCVDCRLCVQVCPTGIDIRDGSQLACIGCALCVDACNSVMDRLNLPRGLISYDSFYNQTARSHGAAARTRLLRPRVYVYGAVIALVAAVMSWGLSTRKTFDLNVLHERSPVFVEISGNRLRNGYTVKVLNKERQEGHFRLSVDDLPDASMAIIGVDGDGRKTVDLTVPADEVGTFQMFITAPKASLHGKKADIHIVATDLASGRRSRHENFFAGPE